MYKNVYIDGIVKDIKFNSSIEQRAEQEYKIYHTYVQILTKMIKNDMATN